MKRMRGTLSRTAALLLLASVLLGGCSESTDTPDTADTSSAETTAPETTAAETAHPTPY